MLFNGKKFKNPDILNTSTCKTYTTIKQLEKKRPAIKQKYLKDGWNRRTNKQTKLPYNKLSSASVTSGKIKASRCGLTNPSYKIELDGLITYRKINNPFYVNSMQSMIINNMSIK